VIDTSNDKQEPHTPGGTDLQGIADRIKQTRGTQDAAAFGFHVFLYRHESIDVEAALRSASGLTEDQWRHMTRGAPASAHSSTAAIKPVWPPDAPEGDKFRSGYVGGWRDCNNWWINHGADRSATTPLTAYVDELERRAAEQAEWEKHPKCEDNGIGATMQVIVNELRALMAASDGRTD